MSSSDALKDERSDVDIDADPAGALHEVSNALTVVLGWLDVAHAKVGSGEARDAIEVARTHARLGYRVARQAIGGEVYPGGISERTARSLARCAVVGITPRATQRGVHVVFDDNGQVHALVRDVGAALQILTNLLLNAIDFTPPGRVVHLTLRESSNSVTFRVSDEGPGIDRQRMATLFSAPTSTRSGGAGLGLRHSHALAQSKGGKLSFVQGDGGATFELDWLLGEARSGARTKSASQESLGGARILVVEDDAAVRSLIELTLEARGAETIVVASREEFDLVTENGMLFDAALIDLSPIAGDVRGALDRLRERSPGVAPILISGVASGMPDDAAGYFSAWVRKPFEMGEVIEVIASVLESSDRFS